MTVARRSPTLARRFPVVQGIHPYLRAPPLAGLSEHKPLDKIPTTSFPRYPECTRRAGYSPGVLVTFAGRYVEKLRQYSLAVGPRWPWYLEPRPPAPYGRSAGVDKRSNTSCAMRMPG